MLLSLVVKRIYVASPLSGPTSEDIVHNINRAKRLCYLAITLGDVAPFAPHAIYTDYLDDTDPEERELGIHAGHAWLISADEVWAYTKNGVSGGMKEELESAESMHIPVVFDPDCWKEVDS